MSEVGRNDALFTALGFEPDRIGRLDPLGALLAEGPDLYPGLLRAMATDIATCRP
jgi:ABC-type Zn2+ transport system substrate-binding protein/surface adhesin